jgi:hypothetical protein
MTKDDIIRMAHEAGHNQFQFIPLSVMERFASLVAAAEREACALVCERRHVGDFNREDLEARRCAEAIRARGEA